MRPGLRRGDQVKRPTAASFGNFQRHTQRSPTNPTRLRLWSTGEHTRVPSQPSCPSAAAEIAVPGVRLGASDELETGIKHVCPLDKRHGRLIAEALLSRDHPKER